ncbi:MAG: hypothetical protein VKK42_19825 [Lyngbya sp.]|nr:hypothetical protein [Lyngbya sp.]
MLKRLIVGLISITLLFQSLVFSSPVYASPVITTENSQAVYEIPFSNSTEFYKNLKQALKSNEPIVIQTDFKSYEEFPKELKEIVKVVDIGVVGAFPNLMMPALLNEKALDLMICVTIAGTGAAIGVLVGGPPGALAGGGLGGGVCLIKDTVDKAFKSPDHSTTVGCGLNGCTITIKPTKPASSVA